MEDSTIEWTHHTFNPWIGCSKISAGCRFCYAEARDRRFGFDLWGPDKDRALMRPGYWREPLRWDLRAEKTGSRERVFCGSLCDVFDEAAPSEERLRLWALIRATPNLDWLMLTKRPENIASMLPPDWGDGYPNVWLGTTVENAEMAEKRIPILRALPATVRFLSIEPLLGPIDDLELEGIDWVIAGGESGSGARPMKPEWVRSIRDQCLRTDVAFFFKQWGTFGLGDDGTALVRLGKKKAGRELAGRTWDEFPIRRRGRSS
jgi:protein gp37